MKKITIVLFMCLMFLMTGCTTSNNGSVSGVSTSSTDLNEVNAKLLDVAITTGPSDSKVTVIEASDFECPACRYWAPQFDKVIEKYVDRVQFGYVAFPLSYHANAKTAAYAVEAANKQKKGMEMYKKVFEGTDLQIDKIEQFAQELGLNMEQFNNDRNSSQISDTIEKSVNLLTELNIQGTPTFYINGKEYAGTPTIDQMSPEIDKLLEQ